ncbi:MAG: hypothetical protein IPK67_19765 [Planctomycetes bacterium]|nr:hypothetical protein [Planctomycetota bacterium]
MLVAGDGGSYLRVIQTSGQMSSSRDRLEPERAPPEAARPQRTVDSRDVASAEIAVREDLSSLALWAPSEHTDASGRARLTLTLPDNLTRYRIMVVAVSGARAFGAGEADVTARLPLMVRPSAPRFLRVGDQLELPVLVENLTSAPLAVDVGLVAEGLGGTRAGQRVSVPAKDRGGAALPARGHPLRERRVFRSPPLARWLTRPPWPCRSHPQARGDLRHLWGHPRGGDNAARGSCRCLSETGGLTVSLSTTQLQALSDAFLSLTRLRYEATRLSFADPGDRGLARRGPGARRQRDAGRR